MKATKTALLTLILAAATAASAAFAGWSEVLRVGTSGDYAPFSRLVGEDPPRFEGFDIAVARAYASDRGRDLEFVRFDWPNLLSSLADGNFDVAMSGVTVRPERSAVGRFTVPLVETGAAVLVHDLERWPSLESLNRRVARVGVNAGGHLERVATARFDRATLLVIPDNDAVIRALIGGEIDAAVTDTLEAAAWITQAEGLDQLGPFTRDRKAYLVRADLPDLAADLDDWLLAREADGTLARLRLEYFGTGAGPPRATPVEALIAAVDERLALMPTVGFAKRQSGMPLEVPERESIVLDAAVAATLLEAERRRVPAPSSEKVRALFRAQMEAAKEVQWAAVKDPDAAPTGPYPDVVSTLRPALIRIGNRIAALLLSIPAGTDAKTLLKATADGLRTPRLSETSIRAIGHAIAELAADANRPASDDANSAPGGKSAGESPGQPAGDQRQRQGGGVAQDRELPAEDGDLPGHQPMERQ